MHIYACIYMHAYRSYDHLISQHTPRLLQHTHSGSPTHTRVPQHTLGWVMLTGSLQLPLRTPIHCVHYWGINHLKTP